MMIYRAVRLSVVFFLIFMIWGCKKDGASMGATEAGDVGQNPEETAPEVEPEQADDQVSTESTEKASQEPAPVEKSEDMYTVRLETTKGDIIIDIHRDWAPLGAERLHELVSSGYYNDVAFFRVIKDFMVQTGVSGKPKLNSKWGRKKLRDEPALRRNVRGTVSFAMAGPNSRTTQFFINLVDNKQLDPMGFTPIGKIRHMTAVDALYSGYGDGPPHGKGPDQQRIKKKGNKFLKNEFPDLDYIITATIIEE